MNSPFVWIGLSVASALVGWGGGLWFSSSDVITGDSTTSYTGKVAGGQTAGLVLQTYFIPLAVACFMIGAPVLTRSRSLAPATKLLCLGAAEVALLALAAAAWADYGWQLLNCGFVFCIWKDVDDDVYSSYSKKPYLYMTMTVYVVFCVYFFVLLLPPTLQTVAAVWSANGRSVWEAVDKSAGAPSEAAPLLGGGGMGSSRAAAQAWAAALPSARACAPTM